MNVDAPSDDLSPSEEECARDARLHAPEREASAQTPPWARPASDEHPNLTRQYREGYADGLVAAASIAWQRGDRDLTALLDKRARDVTHERAELHHHSWIRDGDVIRCETHGKD